MTKWYHDKWRTPRHDVSCWDRVCEVCKDCRSFMLLTGVVLDRDAVITRDYREQCDSPISPQISNTCKSWAVCTCICAKVRVNLWINGLANTDMLRRHQVETRKV
jgi:hypothetical protein